jgi:hypothetical protein
VDGKRLVEFLFTKSRKNNRVQSKMLAKEGATTLKENKSIKSNTTTRRNGDRRLEISEGGCSWGLCLQLKLLVMFCTLKKSYFFNGFTDLLVACSSFTFFPKIP